MNGYRLARIIGAGLALVMLTATAHIARGEEVFGDAAEQSGGSAEQLNAKSAVPSCEKPASPLAKIVVLNFKEATLDDVAKELQKHTGITVLLDDEVTDELAARRQPPDEGSGDGKRIRPLTVTIAIPAMTARSAMRHVLHNLDPELTFVSRDGTLLVTSKERSLDSATSVVYQVADLLPQPGKIGLRHHFGDPPSNETDAAQWLAEVIKTMIHPMSWSDQGGAAQVRPLRGTLVVRQMPDEHEMIDTLLCKLREANAARDKVSREPISVNFWVPGLEAEQRIQKALARKVNLDGTPKSIRELLNDLERQLALPIMVDERSVRNHEHILSAPFSLKCRDIAATVALQQVLSNAPEVKWELRNEALVILDRDEVQEELPLYLYPVSHLVPGDVRSQVGRNDFFNHLLDLIVENVEPESWDANGGAAAGATCCPVGALAIRQTKVGHEKVRQLLENLGKALPPRKMPANGYSVSVYHLATFGDQQLKPAQIADLVRKLVRPESWKAESVTIEVVGNQLVIRQTEEVHAEIEELLLELNLLERRRLQGCGSSVPIVG